MAIPHKAVLATIPYKATLVSIRCVCVCACVFHSADRSDNFVVGLTNVSTQQQTPVLFNYDVCGQYPGAVPSGGTVSLPCNDANLPPARYVIVQFPVNDYMNIVEVNVCAEGWSRVRLQFPLSLILAQIPLRRLPRNFFRDTCHGEISGKSPTYAEVAGMFRGLRL